MDSLCNSVRAVPHGSVAVGARAGRVRNDAGEHAQAGPAHEAVVKRVVRPINRRSVSPAQAVAQNTNCAAMHPFAKSMHELRCNGACLWAEASTFTSTLPARPLDYLRTGGANASPDASIRALLHKGSERIHLANPGW
jgi:hypothetical protein